MDKIKKGAMVLTLPTPVDTVDDGDLEEENAALERYRQQRIQELMDERSRQSRFVSGMACRVFTQSFADNGLASVHSAPSQYIITWRRLTVRIHPYRW